jgi:peptidoglycan/LPS O-acetylase OafA/YrhL
VKKEKEHLFFIDHIRIALIVLVISHHAGQAYGPGGWWYFQEGESIEWLKRFFSVNAAFFMSLFFFLSAYFLPQSIESKGEKKFLQQRFIRLGIPLVLGFTVMIPLLMYLYYINFRGYEPISIGSYYLNIFLGFGDRPTNWTGPSWPDMQFGHLWFLEHLLVYALLLSFWTYLKRKVNFGTYTNRIKGHHIFSFILVVSLLTFIIRIWHPIDQWTGVLGFIQTEYAHLPQYMSFFGLGIFAYHQKWLMTLNSRTGYIWLSLGILITLILYFGGNLLFPFLLKGGANFGSFARSFIETLLCISLVIGLFTLFRDKLNKSSRFLNNLAANVFVVYFIHVPVVVFLQYQLSNIPISVWAKFLLTTTFGSILSFLFAHYVWRKIPLLKRLM